MRLRGLLGSAGITAAFVGAGILLALGVGACGEDQEAGMEPAASQTQQTAARRQLPSIDLNAPREFQTATFAFG
jgi:hypothetical protein